VVIDAEGPPSAPQLAFPHPDIEADSADAMASLEAAGGFSAWQEHWREWVALRRIAARYTDPALAYSEEQIQVTGCLPETRVFACLMRLPRTCAC